jgi:hypothetical protein
VQSPPPPADADYGWEKKVHAEFTDRTLVLTVKIHLINRTQQRPARGDKESHGEWKSRCDAVPVGAAVPEAARQNMKTTIEDVYRDELYFHRDGCGRGDPCDCALDRKCCKFTLEVKVEFVETSGPMIHEVNLWPSSGRASSNNWYRIESRPGKSWAHETGHLMGFYDEYSTGALGDPPWQRSSATSIMGSGEEVFTYHMEEFRIWFVGELSEAFDLLEQ